MPSNIPATSLLIFPYVSLEEIVLSMWIISQPKCKANDGSSWVFSHFLLTSCKAWPMKWKDRHNLRYLDENFEPRDGARVLVVPKGKLYQLWIKFLPDLIWNYWNDTEVYSKPIYNGFSSAQVFWRLMYLLIYWNMSGEREREQRGNTVIYSIRCPYENPQFV